MLHKAKAAEEDRVPAGRNHRQGYLQRLIHFASVAPRLTVCLGIAVAGVSLWVTVQRLDFETSRNALASAQARYVQLEKAIENDFGGIEYLIVVIDPPNAERGKQFVDALAARLRDDTQHVERVVDKIDTTRLEGKKLLLLSPDDLRTLKQRLSDAQDFMHDLSEAPGLVQLLTSLNQEISKALVAHITGGFLGLAEPTTSEGGSQSLDVSFLAALFTETAQAIAAPDAYLFQSPWERFFLKKSDLFSEEGYLTSDQDRFFFVLVDDHTTKGSFVKHAAPLQALRAHLQALREAFPDVQAGVTGSNALSSDEMVAARHDTILATAIALIGVAVLFIVTFRQLWHPLLVVAMLVVAICWTLGFTTLTVGHLNILSVSFLPILIGLGIDAGIHFLARYGEERARHQGVQTALQTAYMHTGPGVMAAVLTTSLAFYAVMLSDFRGLVELGFIAGSGMLLCLLASITVLPALLTLSERRYRPRAPEVWRPLPYDPLRSLRRFPRTILGVVLLLTLAGAVLLPLPRFDYNLLNLQAKKTESVVWEHRLLEESDHSSWYAIHVVDSLDELYRKKAQFAALPVVERVASIASIIPPDQALRLSLVKELAPYVPPTSADWEHLEPIDLDDIDLLLQKIRFKLQRDASDWDPQKRPSETDLNAARDALLTLQQRLAATSPEAAQAALLSFQRHLMVDFADKLSLLQRNLDPTAITLADVPEHLQQRYVSNSGRYLLQIFARENIWERDSMKRFVTQVQATEADVTGAPVIAFYSIQQMQQGYTRGGLYALLAIISVIFLLFRRLKPTLLTLIPVLFGGLWTMACMALFDLQLNLANLIILPLFLGIAVDDGIHLVHRMLQTPEDAVTPLARSTGKAIVLTSLTSITGFGSLAVAQHAGIFSLGVLATLGIGWSLVATLVVMPLVIHLFPPTTCPPASKRLPASVAVSETVSPPDA